MNQRQERHGRRRLLPSRVAVTVGVLLLLSACTRSAGPRISPATGSRPTTDDTRSWHTFVSRSAGFRVSYPEGWHVIPVQTGCGTVSFEGVVIANLANPARSSPAPNVCAGPVSGLPPTGVAFFLRATQGPTEGFRESAESSVGLPLQLGSFKPVAGIMRSRSVTMHHISSYFATVWLEPKATPADTATLERVLASVRPWSPPVPNANVGRCVNGWKNEPQHIPGAVDGSLTAVSARKSGTWAVGSYSHTVTSGSGSRAGKARLASGPLILRWGRDRWNVVPSSVAWSQGVSGGSLRDVAAIGRGDVWVVGSLGDYGLIEHWDGRRWSVVPSPKVNLVDTTLVAVAVAGTGPSDAWAIGSGGLHGKIGPEIEHWDGRSWTLAKVPSFSNPYTSADAVSTSSATDAWVVGQDWDHALALHWDGSAWKVVPAPNVRSTRLTGIVDLSPSDAWAVGTSYANVNGAGPAGPVLEHWDGTSWKLSKLPTLPPDTSLSHIAASGPRDIWVTGFTSVGRSSDHQIVLRYDGHRWTLVQPPATGARSDEYEGLSATTAGAWVVGATPGNEFYVPSWPFTSVSC